MNQGNIKIYRVFLIFLAVFLCHFLSGCITPLLSGNIRGPQTYLRKINRKESGGRRSYLVHVPKDYSAEKKYPVLIVLHGAYSTPEEIEYVSGFSSFADLKGFVVVYPQGKGVFWFRMWNAGYCCGKVATDNTDDVGFVEASIHDLSCFLSIDKSRVYVAGFSNGRMLTYRLAAEKPGLIAAAAVVAGSIGQKDTEIERLWSIPSVPLPVPLIIIHGRDDGIIPYDGGRSTVHKNRSLEFMSIKDSIDYWIRKNRCNPQSTQIVLFSGSVLQEKWIGCQNDVQLMLYSIDQWPHLWPGAHSMSNLRSDHPLKDFDAAELIWEYVSRYRRTLVGDSFVE